MSGVVQREGLFARLDGSGQRVLAWISAPPGFGKSTLASSYVEARQFRWAWYQVGRDDDDGETFLHYLSHATRRLGTRGVALPVFGPEHHSDIAAFARRYFRVLFDACEAPAALVLDNLHELAPDSPLLDILEAALSQLPRQGCVVVTSRTPPPARLARLQPSGQMICLEAADLKFNPSELSEMALLRGEVLGGEALKQLHRDADGWAAALVLMVEHRKLSRTRAQAPEAAAGAQESLPGAVFSYFAGEIFEHFDASTQGLLLQLACLPRVTIEIARALTGDPAVGRVLFNLAHNDYFVRELVGELGRVFVFHPLLREFLLRRAQRDLPQAVEAPALRRAALLLRDAGQHEEAIDLLVDTRSWAEVATLVAEQADSLLAQGRQTTLAAWIDLLPAPMLAASAELLLAHGRALLLTHPRLARRSFEQAFGISRCDIDTAARRAASEGVIAAVLAEFDDLSVLDRWLAEHDLCRGTTAADQTTPSVVAQALLWRDPTHRSLSPSGARVGSVATQAGGGFAHGRLMLALAALLRADFANVAALTAGLSPPDGLTRQQLAATRALHHLVDGDAAAARAAADDGLAMAAAQAIHGQDTWLKMLRAGAALDQADAATARAALDSVDALAHRRGDRALLHYLRSGVAVLEGQPGNALREARGAALLATEAGLPWVECLARLALAQGLAAASDPQGAQAQWRSADTLARQLGSPLLCIAALFTQAGISLASNHDSLAIDPLLAGLTMARDLGVRRVVGLRQPLLASLCALALRRAVLVDHTRSIIQAANLAAPAEALHLRSWPWRFQVDTLGGFDLRRQGEPLEFSAKGPGRPVELLKVLIALGGQAVRIDQLADALWPRVDADYAHKSFTATLHRLRRILGTDDTLKLSDGRLSLNPGLFWVDTWALDLLMADTDARLRDPDDPGTADPAPRALLDDMLALYRGPFLGDDDDHPAYMARREQLRARLMRCLTRVVRRCEESGQSDAALEACLRLVDADELYEPFHRQLMACQQRRGETADALASYERLQAVLAARLNGQPGADTQLLRASLRG